MPTDYQGSSSPSFTRFGRSILSMNRDPVGLNNHTHEALVQEQELEAFQRQVTQRFHDLSLVEPHELLSLAWVSKLLDVFLCCQEQFRVILLNNKSYLRRQPMDKLISDYFERSVKGLDVCNAIRDGVEQMRQWQKQLEIVLCALENPRTLGEAQFRRAKRALIDLAIGMVDEEESNSNLAHRNRSFERNRKDLQHQESKSWKHSRSLSWSVLGYWSASKQLQAIGNIVPPKTSEMIATNGLVLAIYTMSHVLSFVMWALVAAIPCQDRRIQSHLSIPKNFAWGFTILSLHERILEESKKTDRKFVCGLLKEIHTIEMYTSYMNELIISVQFPLGEEQKDEVKKIFEELVIVYESLKNGLDPLERQVREVFHQIVRSRIEGLDSVARRRD